MAEQGVSPLAAIRSFRMTIMPMMTALLRSKTSAERLAMEDGCSRAHDDRRLTQAAITDPTLHSKVTRTVAGTQQDQRAGPAGLGHQGSPRHGGAGTFP